MVTLQPSWAQTKFLTVGPKMRGDSMAYVILAGSLPLLTAVKRTPTKGIFPENFINFTLSRAASYLVELIQYAAICNN